MKISMIIPCLNEERNILPVYQKLSHELKMYSDYEIIFIDDGSTDHTLEKIKTITQRDPNVKYISFSRNFGYETAFRIGFEYASHEWCIQYDADMQSPSHEIHKLIKKSQDGFDVVFGVRQQRDDPFYRILGSRLLHWTACNIFRINMPPGSSTFRIVKNEIAKKIIYYPTRAPFFIATVPLVTSRYATVKTAHKARETGKSKFTLGKLLKQTLDLYFGFSDFPIKIIWIFLILYLLLLLLASYFENSMNFKFIFGLGGAIVMISLGIVAEYIKRPLSNKPHHEMAVIQESNINTFRKLKK